ncbi:type II toxin-antitoxin system RelE/ParE family toxin [Novosphingobium sp. AP12]|uniref:type II toxin-antitoxin system RelE family toxin n=1 Tax=Novosphingobium sp. AP12 TaxID=1144305 RepID=UPI001EE692D1|nr:type II toxin-antitoxin system RelE/ParE family toxin [Novosphingobium sp. AP12]
MASADDPRSSGKALAGQLAGLWRYRVGDYRLICEIEDGKHLILVVTIGHRGDIYR